MLRLPARERIPREVVGVAEMIDARERREDAPVVYNPPNGDPAKTDAVIPTLTPDETGPRRLPRCAVVGKSDLEGCVDRL